MPNIEIHGFVRPVAKKWEIVIFELFKGSGIENDIYVEIYDSRVKHSSGRDAPFLRLSSTKDTIKQARKILGKLGIDLESPVAIQFAEGGGKFDRHSLPPNIVV